MEEFLRKFKHPSPHSHGGGFSHTSKQFRKTLISVVIALVTLVVTLIILTVLLINWLLHRGSSQTSQPDKTITEQIRSLPTPTLDLKQYITNNQVDTQKLEETYKALPGPLKDAWLNQLQTQINELKNQTGISDETIKALTALYQTLKQTQGQ